MKLRLTKSVSFLGHPVGSIHVLYYYNHLVYYRTRQGFIFIEIAATFSKSLICRASKIINKKAVQLCITESELPSRANKFTGFRLRNDLYCVGWGVKLYSISIPLMSLARLDRLIFR